VRRQIGQIRPCAYPHSERPRYSCETFFARTADKKIDVAVAITSPALDFLLSYGDAIFSGGFPSSFAGSIDESFATALPPHIQAFS